jgi:hypothetical protein
MSLILPINSIIQSYLQKYNNSFHHRRQGQSLLIYCAIVAVVNVLGSFTQDGAYKAALLGLSFPGAGFLHWTFGDQLLLSLGLFAGSLCMFGAALVLWFATGNVIAPVACWIGLAVLAGRADFVGLIGGDAVNSWSWLIAPAFIAAAFTTWFRPIRPHMLTLPACPLPGARVEKEDRPALSTENCQRLRLLLDRALQPVDRFEGFEWRDQFQTAAVRYQVNFIAYALAMAQRRHAPAARACFDDAQMRLLAKIGDRRLWRYWRLENVWGNLRFDADPVPRQNIMYSGFTLLQMALGDGNTLDLHQSGKAWKTYNLDNIAGLLEVQYRASRYGLLACEPNWIYPLCNLITMAGIKASDARLGTDRWERLSKPFLAALQREGTRVDGSFIAFRSSLTGIAPPAPGGIVMQAFPCLFLNALSPELAQEHWHRVRQRLDHGSWDRLFWPVDVGNYGFSRASGYAATAAAAVEMGDSIIADECLRRLELECPSHELSGAIHRERASLWAHALEIFARCNRTNGLRDLVSHKPDHSGLHLSAAPYPDVLIIRAVREESALDVVLDPGQPGATPLIELGGLLPGRHYRTGSSEQPFVRTDENGKALLRISLDRRTHLLFEPVV